MTSARAAILRNPHASVEDHPLVPDINTSHVDRLTRTERLCKNIADATGAPIALMLAVVVQMIWVAVGSLTKWDPYPFAFLLTCSNILQLVLIFVIAVAQKQSSQHAEMRAEADHDSISRLLHHQEVQEEILMRIAAQTRADVEDIKDAVSALLTAA